LIKLLKIFISSIKDCLSKLLLKLLIETQETNAKIATTTKISTNVNQKLFFSFFFILDNIFDINITKNMIITNTIIFQNLSKNRLEIQNKKLDVNINNKILFFENQESSNL